MNMLQSSDRRMKAIKENSILSFNAAADFSVDFVEFDVQVRFPAVLISSIPSADGCPATGKIPSIYLRTVSRNHVMLLVRRTLAA